MVDPTHAARKNPFKNSYISPCAAILARIMNKISEINAKDLVLRSSLWYTSFHSTLDRKGTHSMNSNSLAQLKALQAEAHTLHKNLGFFTQRLDALVAEQNPTDAPETTPSDWKREDGRLSDKGVTAMEMMFQSGRSVTEVAKSFDITVSAASHRKRIWQAKNGPAA